MKNLLVLVLALSVQLALALRTAVVLDAQVQTTHSKFFKLLTARGHEVHFFTDEVVELEKFGERMFENLIVFAPNKKLKVSNAEMLKFIENGGNILLASSSKITKAQREFAIECGVEFTKKGQLVLDNTNFVEDPEDIYNSIVTSANYVASDRVVGKELAKGVSSKNTKPVAFSGMGMTLEPSNILGFYALTASETAYVASPVKKVGNDVLIGRDIGLVTAVQARNNARVVFSGSLDLFSDKYFTSQFANEQFADAVTKWNFQESGVLRMTNVHHQREDGSAPDRMLHEAERPDQPITLYPDAEMARDSLVYRVRDNLTYSFDIHELKDGKWVGYEADDVQLEFVMLDPYVRKTMTHVGKGHYTVTFESPDQYGIFLFRVVYRRLGLTALSSKTQVSLRPYKHDEYERFIPAAFPYYASAFSMMIGVFVFSVFFLFHQDK